MANIRQNLINSVLGDGARPTKFRIMIPITNDESLDVICKGAQFPGMSVETIDIKYKGRSIPIVGQQKYTQTWEATFYLEEDHNYRNFFIQWMKSLNTVSYSENKPTSQLKTQIIVEQLNFELDTVTNKVELFNAFPINITDVSLGSDEVGNVSEYTVNFAFSHFEIKEVSSTLKAEDIAQQLMDNLQSELTSGVNSIKDKLTPSDSVIKKLNSFTSGANADIKSYLGIK